MTDYRENFEKVLTEMARNILFERIGRDIIRCTVCNDKCKADGVSASAPLECADASYMENSWMTCNHYMCRECVRETVRLESYTCPLCDEDLTWWIDDMRHEDGFWEFDEDEEYLEEVEDDIDSGAETE